MFFPQVVVLDRIFGQNFSKNCGCAEQRLDAFEAQW